MPKPDDAPPPDDEEAETTPSDLLAERCVIGCALLDAEACRIVREALEPADFYLHAHQQIAAAVWVIAGKEQPVDVATVTGELKHRRHLTGAGGTPYLVACVDEVPTTDHAARYAEIVKAKAVQRQVIEVGNRIGELGRDNGKATGELVEDVRELVDGIRVPEKTLPTRNGEELMRELDSVQWLWPGWLPRGFVTCIAGAPGIKKSALALHMAVQLGCAGKWPDGTQMTDASGTLWLDAENMQRANVDRLRDWKADGSAIHWIGEDGLAPVELSRKGFFEECGRTAVARGCAMVVLDSLSAAHEDDPDSNKEMGRLLREMTKTAQMTNLAVLLTHHPRKKRESESAEITLDRFRGASAIGQMVRVAWGAWQPDKHNPAVRVAQVKNNFALYPEAFGVVWEARGLKFVEAPEEPETGRPISQRSMAEEIIEAVLFRGPKPYGLLWAEVEAQGINEATFNRARRALGLRQVEIRQDGKPIKAWALPTKREQ